MNLLHHEFTTRVIYHTIYLPQAQFTDDEFTAWWIYNTRNLSYDKFSTGSIYRMMNLPHEEFILRYIYLRLIIPTVNLPMMNLPLLEFIIQWIYHIKDFSMCRIYHSRNLSYHKFTIWSIYRRWIYHTINLSYNVFTPWWINHMMNLPHEESNIRLIYYVRNLLNDKFTETHINYTYVVSYLTTEYVPNCDQNYKCEIKLILVIHLVVLKISVHTELQMGLLILIQRY